MQVFGLFVEPQRVLVNGKPTHFSYAETQRVRTKLLNTVKMLCPQKIVFKFSRVHNENNISKQ